MTQQRIAILGAGLLGRSVALAMARAGLSVTVFEKDSSEGTSSAAYVAASMLAPLAESVGTEPSIVKMGYYSLDKWRSLVSSLKMPVFFQQDGSVIVWHQQDSTSSEHFARQLQFVCSKIPELPKPEFCDSQKLSTLEPQLSKHFHAGMYLPNEGQLDNRDILHALLDAGYASGVNYQFKHACNLEDFPCATFDRVIDCRGLGSKNHIKDLRGVRGEVIRVYAPEVLLNHPIRLIHPKYPIYIAPKRDHLFVIGATEVESEDISPISVRSTLELLSAAYSVHSGFAEARIIEANAQCRPTLKNNLPRIQHLDKNILQVNGLYRHGFLITPAIVDAVLEIVLNNNYQLAEQFDLIPTQAIQ
jgi:glycine oxidase